MLGINDFLINVDYLTLAMIQSLRIDIMKSKNQVDCLSIFMKAGAVELERAGPIIRIAERIKKVMLDKQD